MSKIMNGQSPELHPKLEMAAKEIIDILKKYDIAGVAIIHSPGFRKLINRLDPSYSIIAVDDFQKVRVKPLIAEPGKEREADQKIVDTVNMVSNFYAMTAQVNSVFGLMLEHLKIKFGIKSPGHDGKKPNL